MFKQVSRSTRRNFCKTLGTVAATTAFLGQNTLSAHASSTQKVAASHRSGSGTNVLLVHGAFADASSWSKVIVLLQNKGYNVLAVQNPLSSLSDDVDTTRQALASLSGPTILVGHSYGGAVITNAGTGASNVRGLVYIAAFAPDAGESVGDINAKFAAPSGSSHILPSYRSGYIWVDPVAFPESFMQDVEKDEAQALAVAQKPIAPVGFGTPSGVPAWKQVPSWYLVSTHDRMINPDAEHFMAKRMGAKTYEVASSHASLISHPQDVVRLIVAAS
jgi:pimeloyl-ACP methyl ester carboxylesterase